MCIFVTCRSSYVIAIDDRGILLLLQNSEHEFDSSQELTVESKRRKPAVKKSDTGAGTSRIKTDVTLLPCTRLSNGATDDIDYASDTATMGSSDETVVARVTTIGSRAGTVVATTATATIGSSVDTVAATTATIGPSSETIARMTAAAAIGSIAGTVAAVSATGESFTETVAGMAAASAEWSETVAAIAATSTPSRRSTGKTAATGSTAKTVAGMAATATVGSKDIVALPDLVESSACSRPNVDAVPGPSGISKKLDSNNISSVNVSRVSKVEKPRLRKRAKVKHVYTNSDDDYAVVDDGQADYIPPNSAKRKHSLTQLDPESKLPNKKVRSGKSCASKQRADTTCVDRWKSKFNFVLSQLQL